MKVCLQTIGLDGSNDMLALHFGRAPTYTVVDIQTEKFHKFCNFIFNSPSSGIKLNTSFNWKIKIIETAIIHHKLYLI